uniref:Secreted protein n=1 Tax=Trichogramma kaykai TaxID=54128 RepID=A0ABD2X882_9HYME
MNFEGTNIKCKCALIIFFLCIPLHFSTACSFYFHFLYQVNGFVYCLFLCSTHKTIAQCSNFQFIACQWLDHQTSRGLSSLSCRDESGRACDSARGLRVDKFARVLMP